MDDDEMIEILLDKDEKTETRGMIWTKDDRVIQSVKKTQTAL